MAADPVGLFLVVYCGQCGAIYGVIPNQPQKPAIEAQQTTTEEPQQPPRNIPPEQIQEPEITSPDRAAQIIKQFYGGLNRRR